MTSALKPVPESARLIMVNPYQPGVYERISPYLQSAIDETHAGNYFGIADIWQMIQGGGAVLWQLEYAGRIFGALVTVVSAHPKRLEMEIMLMGSEPHTDDLWLDAFEQLKATAKNMGVTSIAAGGRKGWLRKLPCRQVYRWVLEIGDDHA